MTSAWSAPLGPGGLLRWTRWQPRSALRLTRLFLRDENGRRPFNGDNETLQADPAFRDHILFNEYFHGDTGRGLGASHQTGWTGCVALLLAGPDSAWAKTTAGRPTYVPKGGEMVAHVTGQLRPRLDGDQP